jgi:hypothetical protein
MRNQTIATAALTFAAVLCLAQAKRIGPVTAYPTAATPGLVNPAVTQDNIKETVCKPGWTKTVRPIEAYTNALKVKQIHDLELTGAMGDYELDHYISLEIGGHPSDPRNLWPEPFAGPYGARVKDQVEDAMHRELCSGAMTLAQVQSCITSDWIACGKSHGVKTLAK